ncbi:MAG: hypothetical protein H6711_18505 [Myxococcales bacterium]|nr:hypothetical protein [Myxococcales bacterium]
MLLVNAERSELHFVDVETGAARGAPLIAAPQTLLQSTVYDPHRGDVLATSMYRFFDASAPPAPYRLLRLQPGREPELVWSHKYMWIHAPQLSPDGLTVAADAMNLHSEVVRVALPAVCAGDAMLGP